MTKMHVNSGEPGPVRSTACTFPATSATSADAAIGGLTSQNEQPRATASNREQPHACALNVPSLQRQCAEVAQYATFTGLNPQQAYGMECVGTCGRAFNRHPYPAPVHAGLSEHGGTVFACPDCAAKPVEDGGLGMDPADGWQGGRA